MSEVLRRICLALSVLVFASTGRAQEPEAGFERVELRVSEVRPNGSVAVDRGAQDGLESGDLVRFFPRDGRTIVGNVATVEERSAVVELLGDGSLALAPGTRGVARVPGARFAPAPDAAPTEAPVSEPAPRTPAARGETPLGDLSQPLLAQMESVRPTDREMRFTGRAVLSADATRASLDNRHDAFVRFGQDLAWDNPFGRGGRLNLDLEENWRRTDIPGPGDEDTTRLRIDRIAYSWGGTRFASDRFTVGRFLQGDLPELGILDGVEYSTRFRSGNRFGASLGFLPEPDDEQETGRDFQFAAWYRWVWGEEERLSLTTALQKTLHDGDADRDLVLAKFELLPRDGWQVFGTAWIDLYTSGDDLKGSGLGLTQLEASAHRRLDTGATLDVSYRHLEFPELDRTAFVPVLDEQIADDHLDRLWLRASTARELKQRLHGALGGWLDEDENGGDVEAGIEVLDLFQEDSRADVTLFGGFAEFNSFLGARLSYGRQTERGNWNVSYELISNEQEDFDLDFDDLAQHRLRASHEIFSSDRWSLALYGQGLLWENENAVSLGFHLQRDF